MQVAPTTGAWIETLQIELMKFFQQSLPPRERGLKLCAKAFSNKYKQSLPPRERGLKLVVVLTTTLYVLVAPTTGAWIETM